MADVVELRVHGVGGTTPEGMLGESSDTKVIRAAGTKLDGFYKRLDEPRVEGYSWGGLTSARWVQALWIFMLPFTLVNVAGWTLPPRRKDKRAWAFGRFAIALLGLSLTVAYVFGAFTLISKRLFVLWGLDDRITNHNWALLLGSGTVMLLGYIVYRISSHEHPFQCSA